jgi:uncharacterized membrane protein HdeD (DUF308 family)
LTLFLVALLLMVCGALELLETFQAANEARRRSTYLSGALSVLAGILLLAQPQLLVRGLAFFLAGSFLIDGIGKTVAAVRGRATGASWKWMLVNGLVNGVLALVLVVQWPVSGRAVVAILVGIRMLMAGWSMLLGRELSLMAEPPPQGLHPDRRLRLPARPEFAAFEESFQAEEVSYRWINAVWCWTFVVVFFAIHIGRMRVEWNLVGMIAPLVAAVGDVATALIIAFGIVLRCRLAWRKMTRPVERRFWERLLARSDRGRGPGLLARLYRIWLMPRMRFSFRMAQARYSPRAALRWGLQVGLPATAILIAVNPIWGFSWFFNSESWTVAGRLSHPRVGGSGPIAWRLGWVLRAARTANGNGSAVWLSRLLLAGPRVSFAAFMKNRLRSTQRAAGARGLERSSLPPGAAVSKGPGTGGSNSGRARSIPGVGPARCARPIPIGLQPADAGDPTHSTELPHPNQTRFRPALGGGHG